MIRRLSSLLLGLFLVLFAGAAVAQQSSSPPAPGGTGAPSVPPQSAIKGPADHIEGELTFLKSQLKITDAQSKLWDTLAETARENVKNLIAVGDEVRQVNMGPHDPIELILARKKFIALRIENMDKIAAKLKPLYDSLDADQKKIADQLLVPHLSLAL